MCRGAGIWSTGSALFQAMTKRYKLQTSVRSIDASGAIEVSIFSEIITACIFSKTMTLSAT
jgi:hypothetical protein